MNPELTVADVEELSKAIRIEIADLYNEEVKIFDKPPSANMKYAQDLLKIRIADRLAKAGYSKLPLSPEKVVGMVILDEEELKLAILRGYRNYGMVGCETLDKEIAQEIISNKSKILGVSSSLTSQERKYE